MSVRSLSATLALSAALVGVGVPTASARPATYELSGDAGGSKFEGIGYDARTQRYYVSETTGGEIHRGQLRSAAATEWLPGDGLTVRLPVPEALIATADCATPSIVNVIVPVGTPPPDAGVTVAESVVPPVRMGALILVGALLTTRVVAGKGATEAR